MPERTGRRQGGLGGSLGILALAEQIRQHPQHVGLLVQGEDLVEEVHEEVEAWGWDEGRGKAWGWDRGRGKA